tara:strand:+ start:7162 stop:8430 length:1269 start_codon:yes stop_codon:yes gene_type:complete
MVWEKRIKNMIIKKRWIMKCVQKNFLSKQIFLYLLSIILLTCSSQKNEFLLFESPSEAGSRFPNLISTVEGTLLMSWLSPSENHQSYSLKFSEFDEGNWSKPVTIFSGEEFFVNWADYPSIFQLNGDTLVTHWLYKNGSGAFQYDVFVSISMDRGANWSDPVIPHRDGISTEHGFVSFYHKDGNAGIVWIDGRNLKKSENDHGLGDMYLYTTTLKMDMNLGPETILDSRICECCPTDAATIGKINLIAYRDRNEDEIRNIQLIRSNDQGWSEPTIVHDDEWKIPGCPVNGPKLAVNGEKLGIAWYTAPKGEARVNLAFSYDRGLTFTEPLRVDDGMPLGRVDLEWIDNNRIVVSWIELEGESAQLKFRQILLGGEMRASQVVKEIDSSRGSGYPQMVKFGKELIFGWTVPVDSKIEIVKFSI